MSRTVLFLFSWCCALLALRYFGLGAPQTMLFLLWNLFLAILPVLLAWLIRRFEWGWLLLPLWILFLPNAPYLISDLMHIRQRPGVLIHFDVVLFFSFALAGLLFGGVAIRMLRNHFIQWRSSLQLGVVGLFLFPATGIGVYLGRELRWNSWDAFFRPAELIRELVQLLQQPILLQELLLVSAAYAGLFYGTYFLIGCLNEEKPVP